MDKQYMDKAGIAKTFCLTKRKRKKDKEDSYVMSSI